MARPLSLLHTPGRLGSLVYTVLVFTVLVVSSVLPVAASTSTSAGAAGPVLVWEKKCYLDFFIRPVYVYNGEYIDSFIVDSPLTLNITRTAVLENGTSMVFEAILNLTPADTGSVRVDSVITRLERLAGLGKKMVVNALVRVPRGSLAVTFGTGLVGGGVTVSVERLNETLFSVVMRLEDIRMDDVSIAGVKKYGAFPLKGWGSPTVLVKLLYNARYGRTYLVDGDRLVEIGDKSPLFAYPEAFDPSAAVREVYENMLEWVNSSARNPSSLVLLAEKVSRAKTVEERIEIVEGFVSKVFNDIVAPGFTYLGRNYVLVPGPTPSWMLGGEWAAKPLRIIHPKGLVEIDSRKLLDLLVKGYSARNAITESITLSDTSYVVEEVNGSSIAIAGYNITRLGGLLLPLPRDNPFKADMLLVEAMGKVFKCSIREFLKELLGGMVNIDDYDIVDLGNNCYLLKNRVTGEEMRECIGDYNGTDYVALLGDQYTYKLQWRAYAAWKSVGGLVRAYFIDMRNTLYDIVLNATKNKGRIDLGQAAKAIAGVREKYSIFFTGEWEKQVKTVTSTTSAPASSGGSNASPPHPGSGGGGEPGGVLLAVVAVLVVAVIIAVYARWARR